MSYYRDVKILVYVKRGAYTVKQCERNVEKFNMLRVLMATAFRDVELNAKALCRDYKFTWHQDANALEIDMPNARWEARFPEVDELRAAVQDLSSVEHQYCAEYTVVDRAEPRGCNHYASGNVKVPLLTLETKAKVNL